jgi:hypothetical protein
VAQVAQWKVEGAKMDMLPDASLSRRLVVLNSSKRPFSAGWAVFFFKSAASCSEWGEMTACR